MTVEKLVRIVIRPFLPTGETGRIGTIRATTVDGNGAITTYTLNDTSGNAYVKAFRTEEEANTTGECIFVLDTANGHMTDVYFYDIGSGYSANDVIAYIYPESGNTISVPLSEILANNEYDYVITKTLYVENESIESQRDRMGIDQPEST